LFDKVHFKNILETALGKRTKEEYSKDSGVSRGYISKCINMKISNPPSPEILKRLASKAHNNVTYEDLMRAAGYIDTDNEDEYITTDNFNNNPFGNKIKELREEMNWTQDHLGKLLNVKRAAISKYENGKVPLTDEILIKLSKIFDVSCDYILGVSNKRNDSKVENKKSFMEKIEDLSPESKEELEKYIELLKLKDSLDKNKDEQSATLDQGVC